MQSPKQLVIRQTLAERHLSSACTIWYCVTMWYRKLQKWICLVLQGFIEGKYVPIQDGDNVPAGTEVLSAEEIAARKTGTTPKDPEKLAGA